jgi:acyl-CoA thioesterase
MNKPKDWETEKARMNKAPYFQLLGMKVVELDKGYARLVVPVEERMNSILGGLHGGVLSSLSDSAVAMALFTIIEPGQKPVTVELNINYLKPVQGDQAIAEAHIVSHGRTIAVGDVDITDDTGRLICKSRATYMLV